VAKDGTEGLAVFDKYDVALALIDLGLPDMSGMKVREDQGRPAFDRSHHPDR
jgi:DNA-binding response OmpR family regulator